MIGTKLGRGLAPTEGTGRNCPAEAQLSHSPSLTAHSPRKPGRIAFASRSLSAITLSTITPWVVAITLAICPIAFAQPGDATSGDAASDADDRTANVEIPASGEVASQLNLKELLTVLEKMTGRMVLYPSTTADPNFDDNVNLEILGQVETLSFDLIKQMLEANGYDLWESELPDGTLVLNMRHNASRTNTPLDPVSEIFKAEKKMPRDKDEQIVTLIVQLRYTDSGVVINTLRELLEFSGAKSQTGTLKIVNLPENQTLILKGKVRTLRHVKALLQYIDVEVQGPEAIMEVRELYYADALDMVDILQQALDSASQTSGATGQTPAATGRATRGSRQRRTTQTATQVGVSTSLIPDTRTQKILIQSTSPEEVQLVHVLIDELDSRVRNIRSKTHVYKVRYLKAEDLRDTVTQLIDGSDGSLTGRSSTAGRTTGRAAGTRGTAQTGQGQALVPSRIVAHPETNSLLIQAEPEEYEEISNILDNIDRKRRQVFLEAALLQVSEASDLNYTFEYLAGNLDDSATRVAALSSFGLSGLDTAQLPNNFARTFGDGAGLSGLVAAVSRDGQLPVILQAVKTDTDSKILATPFILADDNQENEISVLTTVYFTQTAQGQVTSTTGQDSDDAGITLRLIPTVSGSVVLLELELEVSDFGRATTGDGALPDKSTNRVTSRVTIPDGEIFIIGGLARENESVAVSKVPILGDLPIIGRLFQSRGSSKARDNLYVLLTAHIIDDPDNNDLRALTESAVSEMKTFQDDISIQRFTPFNRDKRRSEIDEGGTQKLRRGKRD